MKEIKKRRLPAGIQSFTAIREGGYAYVDKTDIVWQIVNEGDKYNYLSRPRRFGKSILVDTLQCYLEGRKELFEGLKIMQFEKDWVKHPVIHFDMSGAGSSREELTSFFEDTFEEYEKKYGIGSHPKTLSKRFKNIIMTAREQSGQKVAVLIDKYDSLCNTLGRLLIMKSAQRCIARCLPFSRKLMNTRSSCLSLASPSSHRFLSFPYSTT